MKKNITQLYESIMNDVSKIIKKHLNESVEEYPSVTILGDGEYRGTQSGYTFNYKNKKYKTSFGIRGMNCPITIIIKDGHDDWQY